VCLSKMRETHVSSICVSVCLLIIVPGLEMRQDSDCSVTDLEHSSVSSTQANISWTSDCPDEDGSYFKLVISHEEYLNCSDKAKNDKLRKINNIPISKREMVVTDLKPMSRYELDLRAVPRTGHASKSITTSFQTKKMLPQVQLQNVTKNDMKEDDSSSLSISWIVPKSDPRVMLTEEFCDQFQGSELGQIHFEVEDSEGGKVTHGNVSVDDTQMKVGKLQGGKEYTVILFLTNIEGIFDRDRGVKIRAMTSLSGKGDGLGLGLGLGLGFLLVFLIIIIIIVLIRRRMTSKDRKAFLPVRGNEYSSARPILRPKGVDIVRTPSSNVSKTNSGPKRTSWDPLPPRPGYQEPIYQEIGQAPLAPGEEEEEEEEEKEYRPLTPASVTEEDEEGYLRPNFHRFELLEPGCKTQQPIPIVSYQSSQDHLERT